MNLKETRQLRLKSFIDKIGGAAQAARAYDLDASYLSQLINGFASFGEKSARNLEAKCQLPPYFLDQLEAKKDLANYEIQSLGKVNGTIPLLSSVQAGAFKEAFEGDWHDCERIKTDAKIKERTFALKVKGDSMVSDGEITFPQGTLLIVEPDMAPVHGDFVIAKNGDNEATFKQLVKDGADWYLRPLNKQYPTKPAKEVDIIGIVIQSQLVTKLK